MSVTQAQQFDFAWTVLAQSPSVWNGFSAVLLQNATTGEKVLAIRGTNDPADIWWADRVSIATVGDVTGMAQYAALETFYQQLVTNGQLGAAEQVVVTGHSLGGFLAQAFTARHDSVVSSAYTYNSPGFGGLGGQLLDWLGIVDGSIANGKITNVQAIDGISIVSGLGFMLGTTVESRVEAGTLPGSTTDCPLSDSLAVQGVLASWIRPLRRRRSTSYCWRAAMRMRVR
jgi:pimeloyl-ACP methyl ester carboxylesterase